MYSVLFGIHQFLTEVKIRVKFTFPLSCSSYWCQWLLQWKWEILYFSLYYNFDFHPRKVWPLPQKSYLCLVSSNKHSFRTLQVHSMHTAWSWSHMVPQCNNGSMESLSMEKKRHRMGNCQIFPLNSAHWHWKAAKYAECYAYLWQCSYYFPVFSSQSWWCDSHQSLLCSPFCVHVRGLFLSIRCSRQHSICYCSTGVTVVS